MTTLELKSLDCLVEELKRDITKDKKNNKIKIFKNLQLESLKKIIKDYR